MLPFKMEGALKDWKKVLWDERDARTSCGSKTCISNSHPENKLALVATTFYRDHSFGNKNSSNGQ